MTGTKLIIVVTFLSLGIVGLYSPSSAGNKQMVEERVEELDELNKQAVRQIPDLPANAKVDMKANVTYKNDTPVFDIYYKNVTGEKEGTLHFGEDPVDKKEEKGKVKDDDDKNN